MLDISQLFGTPACEEYCCAQILEEEADSESLPMFVQPVMQQAEVRARLHVPYQGLLLRLFCLRWDQNIYFQILSRIPQNRRSEMQSVKGILRRRQRSATVFAHDCLPLA